MPWQPWTFSAVLLEIFTATMCKFPHCYVNMLLLMSPMRLWKVSTDHTIDTPHTHLCYSLPSFQLAAQRHRMKLPKRKRPQVIFSSPLPAKQNTDTHRGGEGVSSNRAVSSPTLRLYSVALESLSEIPAWLAWGEIYCTQQPLRIENINGNL